ncbi:hypothetical protein A8C75_08925 [Marinobacterium aestuarii]|uniref:Uncharacterized protein n=1 Tax=Marinobacterium aestuarii TaxID=1821621 RepID=A0A1A9EYN3_9GAMM|nr:hypothetical protein A8C75_08925 [Marinobacterium aestuarii]
MINTTYSHRVKWQSEAYTALSMMAHPPWAEWQLHSVTLKAPQFRVTWPDAAKPLSTFNF